jgi:hypothetical protein
MKAEIENLKDEPGRTTEERAATTAQMYLLGMAADPERLDELFDAQELLNALLLKADWQAREVVVVMDGLHDDIRVTFETADHAPPPLVAAGLRELREVSAAYENVASVMAACSVALGPMPGDVVTREELAGMEEDPP